MGQMEKSGVTKLSIVIPCFNEERTLVECVERVLEISDDSLSLELIIVDDYSTDKSLEIAKELASKYIEITVCHHEVNQGKGAALRTGFQKATGDFVAVQDADLEYDPMEFKKILVPLIDNKADVVFGSRFLSPGVHRVLYFWHSLGNRFLTFLSNMFTDLNLTDMETCYKVFRREVIQSVTIEENRFGFEPEIVAKVSNMRLRIFEVGISYYGRTYEEGKKIGTRDGFRALYCIFRYNAHVAPLPVQFLIYLFIGGIASVANVLIFLSLLSAGSSINASAPIAFIVTAVLNYMLCILILFKHTARWTSSVEMAIFTSVVFCICILDLVFTKTFFGFGFSPGTSKLIASAAVLILNFLGRRFFVFPEPSRSAWKAQEITRGE